MLSLNNRITALENTSVVAFKAVSNVVGTYTFSEGTVAPFNDSPFCVPDATKYDTAESSYTVPVEGIYQFTIKMHSDVATSITADLALYKNGSPLSFVGVSGSITSVVTDQCAVGDVYQVKMHSSGSNVQMTMTQGYAHFEGHLIY